MTLIEFIAAIKSKGYKEKALATLLYAELYEGLGSLAAGQIREVSEKFGAERVGAALREWLPRAVNFFGPPDSGFTYDCIRYGLKARDNWELAELYLSLLERPLRNAGLEMPRLTPDYPHAIA